MWRYDLHGATAQLVFHAISFQQAILRQRRNCRFRCSMDAAITYRCSNRFSWSWVLTELFKESVNLLDSACQPSCWIIGTSDPFCCLRIVGHQDYLRRHVSGEVN